MVSLGHVQGGIGVGGLQSRFGIYARQLEFPFFYFPDPTVLGAGPKAISFSFQSYTPFFPGSL
jgi:hypothetical protein